MFQQQIDKLEQLAQPQKNAADQPVSYENSKLTTIDPVKQPVKEEISNTPTEVQNVNVPVPGPLVKEEISRFQFPEVS